MTDPTLPPTVAADSTGVFLIMAVVLIGLTFLLAKWSDVNWRCKQKRKFQKKNFIVMYIVSKDNKDITPQIVNVQQDMIKYKNNVWVIEDERVYRKDRPEEGFKAKKSNIKWENEVPLIFVDGDHLTPLDFWKPEGQIKPEHIGGWVNAWIDNQMAKLAAANKNQQMILLILVIIMFANIAITYQGSRATVELKKEFESYRNQTLGNNIGKVVNGTLIIEGPKGG